MRNANEANLTDAVLARLEGAKDPRFKKIMTSLITHLHAGVRPGTSDRAEMGLMGREKVQAAAESVQAMAQGVFALNQQLFALATRQLFAGLPMMFSLATSFAPSRFAAGQARVVRAAMANSNAATARISTAVPRIAGKALKPIHARAAANRRRLAKR